MYDYIMTKREEEDYTNNGIASPRLKSFWNTFIETMPMKLRLESIDKGYQLVLHPLSDVKDDSRISYNMKFQVKGASKELQKFLDDSDENIIICMHDEI